MRAIKITPFILALAALVRVQSVFVHKEDAMSKTRWFLVTALVVGVLAFLVWLIPQSTLFAHPVYGPNGEVVGETLEYHPDELQYYGPGIADVIPKAWGYEEYNTDEVVALLEECLEFIEDVDLNADFELIDAIAKSQNSICPSTGWEKAGDNLKSKSVMEKALHKRIVEAIKRLKGE